MRSFSLALRATVAAAMLAGCSGNYVTAPSKAPISVIPPELRPTRMRQVLSAIRPFKKKKHIQQGIYAAGVDSSYIFGYAGIDQDNGPPVCLVPSFDTNGISVDSKGDMLSTDAEGGFVSIAPGPNLCGSPGYVIYTRGGMPVDAASNDALTGSIAVAMYGVYYGKGGIDVCTLSPSSCTLLTNPNIPVVVAVAMAKNGDCWADGGGSPRGPGVLVYFQGCSGSGQLASGFQGAPFGGLDIDRHGNLVAVDQEGFLYVYKGCNPVCKLVGGPFGLYGGSAYGKVNKQADLLAIGDFENGQIDIYYYAPTGIDYEYSITNGLSGGDEIEGAAFAPRSPE